MLTPEQKLSLRAKQVSTLQLNVAAHEALARLRAAEAELNNEMESFVVAYKLDKSQYGFDWNIVDFVPLPKAQGIHVVPSQPMMEPEPMEPEPMEPEPPQQA